jgi:hypothetical protein
LSDEMMKVWQKLYSQGGAQEAPKNDDWVVDWEVETDGNTTRV